MRSMPDPALPSCSPRGTVALVRDRARLATFACFFLTGAVFAAWASRLPAVQERAGLGAGGLAAVLMVLNAGAIAGLAAGGALVTWLGSRAALRIGFAVFPAGLALGGLATSGWWLAAAAALMAAGNSVVDVAMNAHGAELERRRGRPLLSGLHAGHSLGMLAGAAAGTAAAAAGVPAPAHFAAAGALGAAGAVAATAALGPGARAAGSGRPVLPRGRLGALGAIAFAAFLAEGAAADWAAVHLRTERGASPGLAAGGFAAFALALAAGRLAGDGVVARLGRRRTVEAGGAVAAAGAALALLGPGATGALAGWALLGAGLAAIAPTVLGAAPGAGPVPAPVAIAAVSTVGYAGSFAGPPAIGALAGAVGLTASLGLIGLAGVAAALLARHGLPVAVATDGTGLRGDVRRDTLRTGFIRTVKRRMERTE
jgi:MFS family permease